jgi:uncharacterized membrane protein
MRTSNKLLLAAFGVIIVLLLALIISSRPVIDSLMTTRVQGFVQDPEAVLQSLPLILG